MNLNEKDLKILKKWLISMLKENVATLTFKRKDGTIRTMDCTLNEEYIGVSLDDGDTNKDTQMVWDIETAQYKSFRWDSLMEIRFTIGENDD